MAGPGRTGLESSAHPLRPARAPKVASAPAADDDEDVALGTGAESARIWGSAGSLAVIAL